MRRPSGHVRHGVLHHAGGLAFGVGDAGERLGNGNMYSDNLLYRLSPHGYVGYGLGATVLPLLYGALTAQVAAMAAAA